MTEPSSDQVEPVEHPIFREGADQLVMLIALLDAMPTQMDGVMVPIHPKIRKPWAEELLARGVRVHPELMEKLPATGGDHPEAAWMNPTAWVNRSEYTARQTEHGPGTAQQVEQLRQMLQAIDPDRAARIDAMTPEERKAEAATMAPHMPETIQRLHAAGEEFIRQQAAARAAKKEDG
ncbi:hypothetical protein [Nocardia wallacei]|uniref:hypothetical protein n=1 Tax=Nocardia wallacei TaxID=480035 RepID=UPI0024586587|nr:hypothetical protein [Nocardia wallacei]